VAAVELFDQAGIQDDTDVTRADLVEVLSELRSATG